MPKYDFFPEKKKWMEGSFCLCSHPFQEKNTFFSITQVLYRLSSNSHKACLSRYIAGFISEIISEKYLK